MANAQSVQPQSTWQLIRTPAIISLAVTLLRLAGELAHWSQKFFNTRVGGGGALVGITWLAPVFGIYFAVKLARRGEGPGSAWRAIWFALLGVAVFLGGSFLGPKIPAVSGFYARLIYVWVLFALAAIATLPGWPALFKVQLAYAYTARIPVAVVMFLAFHQNWVTHYSAVPHDMPAGMGLWSKFLWLGFFPQLIFWVGFTVVTGMLFGAIVGVFARFFKPASE
jgi:hypothetical protein